MGRDLFAVIFFDITEEKRAEEAREKLVLELEEALAEIKSRNGILNMCSYCKRIRNAPARLNLREGGFDTKGWSVRTVRSHSFNNICNSNGLYYYLGTVGYPASAQSSQALLGGILLFK